MSPRPHGRTAVVATLTEPAGPGAPPVPAGAEYLEVRADLCGEPDPAALRRHVGGRLIYTLRSACHGGRCADPPPVRHRRLAAAAHGYDLIDLEADHDLVPEVLDAVPAQRRRISWHGAALPAPRLADRFAAMATVPAALYLLAPAVRAAGDALLPLELLARLRRRDLTAYGDGPAGAWSRLVAPMLGAPTVAGPLTSGAGDGVPTATSLCDDYAFPAVPPAGSLCGLIGRAAAASAFPALFNAAYRWYGEPGLPGLYLPFYLPGLGDFLTGFWPGVPDGLARLGLPLCGLTVSGPLKEAALHVADTAGPAGRAAGGANALIRRGATWHADTTDGTAVTHVLGGAGVRLAGRRAAVVGCGGAGRAAAVALAAAGAEVTVVNRGERRGELVAELLGLPFVPLATFAPAGSAVVVHATPLHTDLPFRLDRLAGDAVVVDMVCPATETPLVGAARRRGLLAFGGPDVLAVEAALQFRLMTGRAMPPMVGLPSGSGGDTAAVGKE
jgi:3-dehydroquinate dehydratase/shikimate dehydrogenase